MFKTVVYNISVWLIPAMVLFILLWGLIKKIPVYEVFVDGAKDGLKVSVNILPYLIAIMVHQVQLTLRHRLFPVFWHI